MTKNVASALVSIGLFCVVYLTACQHKEKILPKTDRDTTITVANAYSEVFFDSLYLEKFITTEVAADSIAQYMRNLYNSRNYTTAWFVDKKPTIQAEGFWNAHVTLKLSSDTSTFDKALHQVMDTLLSGDSTVKLSSEKLLQTELRFTKHFFEHVSTIYAGKVNPETVQWYIPRRKVKPLALLDSFLANTALELKPVNRDYELLQKELYRFREIDKSGGWPVLQGITKKLKKGDSNKNISMIKQQLHLMGYTAVDTTYQFDEAMDSVVRRVEASFGLKQDGIIDSILVKKLNVPVTERIKQLLINLERMRWMPETPASYLLANIPEYQLHVVADNAEVFTMNIVVGKAANRSVIFSDELRYIVFSPYWNVPESIVRNEILPGISRNANYLARHNMEITGGSSSHPVVRQNPGGANALGKVKFIFPNRFNIYFHDTPSKTLFSRTDRAFSHGCIRLQEPFKLAQYLLRDAPEWTEEKINEAMNQTKEKWVTLKQPVPVFITYFTAWVDTKGLLHFVDDVYGHDKALAAHLFEAE